MHNLSLSIHHLIPGSERKNQKRAALQLLALSGVVRPSHVELRYPTPPRQQNRLPRAARYESISADPTVSFAVMGTHIVFHLKQIWQWVNSLGMTQREGRKAGRNDRGTCAV